MAKIVYARQKRKEAPNMPSTPNAKVKRGIDWGEKAMRINYEAYYKTYLQCA